MLPVAVLAVAALFLIAIAGYAQWEVGHFTAGASQALLTRSVLAVLGIAAGFLLVRDLEGTDLQRILTFVAGFGAVHVPAAGVLALKKLRHERPS